MYRSFIVSILTKSQVQEQELTVRCDTGRGTEGECTFIGKYNSGCYGFTILALCSPYYVRAGAATSP